MALPDKVITTCPRCGRRVTVEVGWSRGTRDNFDGQVVIELQAWSYWNGHVCTPKRR